MNNTFYSNASKYKIGVATAILGTAMYMGATSQTEAANTIDSICVIDGEHGDFRNCTEEEVTTSGVTSADLTYDFAHNTIARPPADSSDMDFGTPIPQPGETTIQPPTPEVTPSEGEQPVPPVTSEPSVPPTSSDSMTPAPSEPSTTVPTTPVPEVTPPSDTTAQEVNSTDSTTNNTNVAPPAVENKPKKSWIVRLIEGVNTIFSGFRSFFGF